MTMVSGRISLIRGQQLEAVHARHAEVGEDDVGVGLLQQGEARRASCALRHLVAVLAQQRLQRGRRVHLVVDDDDPSLDAHDRASSARRRRPRRAARHREARRPAAGLAARPRSRPRAAARSAGRWTARGRCPWAWWSRRAGRRPRPAAARGRCRAPRGGRGRPTSPLSTVTAPPVRHGLDGVADQVDHDLLHLLGVHAHAAAWARRRARGAASTPRGAASGAQQAHHLVDDGVQVAPAGAGCGRSREKSRKSPTSPSRRRISSRMTPASSPISLASAGSQRADAALQDRELEADRVERVADLVGEAGGEGAQHRHLLALDDAGLGLLQLAIGAPLGLEVARTAQSRGRPGCRASPGSAARPPRTARPGRAATLSTPRLAPSQAQRDAGVGDGLGRGPSTMLGMRGHCVVLRACMRCPAPEHLGTEAIAESLRADLVEVDGRDPARGRQPQLAVGLVPQEDPRGVQAHPAEDRVERDFEDALLLLLAVDAGGHVSEDAQLPLAALQRLLESVRAVFRGFLQAFIPGSANPSPEANPAPRMRRPSSC